MFAHQAPRAADVTTTPAEYVLVLFPSYLAGEERHDAWDLQDRDAFTAGRPHYGGDNSLPGIRTDDPATPTAWNERHKVVM